MPKGNGLTEISSQRWTRVGLMTGESLGSFASAGVPCAATVGLHGLYYGFSSWP
ncbi:mCG142409 [Mus musculus]|nr:mCG142409 [Mus musculus]